MTVTNQNFTAYIGEDKEITFFPIVDEDEILIDLTDYTLDWYLYEPELRSVLLHKTNANAITPSSTGTAVLNLAGSGTANLNPSYYDHELIGTATNGIKSVFTTGQMILLYSK